MKFQFDHNYAMDQAFAFRSKLGRAGFFLLDKEAVHPGKHHCRFITFKTELAGYHYLEFVHIGKGGIKEETPGLSFMARGSLEKFGNTQAAKNLNLKVVHRNYDWKPGDTERRPGWNFGNFIGHKSLINIWLTEYEPRDPKKKHKRPQPPKHPNGAFEISEMSVTLSAKDFQLYSKLLGKPKNGLWILGDHKFKLHFTKGNASRINFVVVKTSNLKKLIKNFEWDDLVVHEEQPAVRIKNPNKKMWDVLIVQG